jgi:hypothetical protein
VTAAPGALGGTLGAALKLQDENLFPVRFDAARPDPTTAPLRLKASVSDKRRKLRHEIDSGH